MAKKRYKVVIEAVIEREEDSKNAESDALQEVIDEEFDGTTFYAPDDEDDESAYTVTECKVTVR